MTMAKSFIQNFTIKGLFGYKDVSIDFDENVKIIIAENGAGKTTILSCLYYLLNGDYESLLKIKFASISIKFESRKEAFCFEKLQIRSYCQYLISSRDEESSVKSFVKKVLGENVLQDLINKSLSSNDIDKLYEVYQQKIHFPRDLWHQILSSLIDSEQKYKTFRNLNQFLNSTGYKFLYYPTYRRIEEDFRNILKNKKRNRHIFSRGEIDEYFDSTIIKFGMDDVEERIAKIVDFIKQSSVTGFASVSGSMITKLLENDLNSETSQEFNIDEVSIVLSRVGKNMSEDDKKKIINQIKVDSDLSEQEPFLRYFLRQLLDVYRKQQKYDTAIKKFVDVCNKYLESKRFVYDESNVSIRIERCCNNTNEEAYKNECGNIDLKCLSSGEKQIVSIFSQLYLELDSKFLILFDEPELSLSLYWQQMLLPDIMESNKCMFMLAVTHSPFIYDNALRDSAVALSIYSK